MKYIKTFENKNKVFKVGQYVIAENIPYKPNLKSFFNDNIGLIIKKEKYTNSINVKITEYIVKYENIPDNIETYFMKNSIHFYSDDLRLATEEEIEKHELNNITNKFNI